MDFNAWNIDLEARSAFHPTGFKLVVEGSPAHPRSVSPGKFPDGLTAEEQVRLLQSGIKAMMCEARKRDLQV